MMEISREKPAGSFLPASHHKLGRKIMKRFTKTVVAFGLAGCAAISSPFVAEAVEPGWYLGGSIGQSRAKIDDARITSSLLGGGATTSSISKDKRGLGYKVFGGYQYNQYISLEGGYFDLGQFGYTATTAAPNAGTVTGKLKLKGVNLDLVGFLPLFEKLSLMGRVGVTYARTRDTFTTTGALTVADPNPSKSDANYKLGLGLEYDIIKALGVRIEAERYRINDAVGNRGDIDLYTAGLVYRFGTSTPAPREEASEPEPVQMVVVPKIVPLKKVSFSTDSLFIFDSAVINPADKRGLDELAEDLKSTNFEIIHVSGYTDRIGSHAYNMALSSERAEAVRDYLVKTAGIPAGKIEARGMGEASPVTKAGECKGDITETTANDAARALKLCLAPDRRVEVEVHATQKRQ